MNRGEIERAVVRNGFNRLPAVRQKNR